MGISSFVKRHPVLFYFILTLTISWSGFFLVGHRGILARSNWQTDPLFQPAVLAMLTGPVVSGVFMTFLVSPKSGLRQLLSRLFLWRVKSYWYAVALLTPPLLGLTVLSILSRFSPVYLPSIVTEINKNSLLFSGIVFGLVGGLMEEMGWTGFAIPRLRNRYSIFTTGLIVGIIWGIWHFLQMWWVGSTSYNEISQFIFLPLYFLFAIVDLTAFRIMMIWVYDHTQSLLLAVLMHASYILSTLFIFAPPIEGAPFLIYSVVFTIALWFSVAVVAVTNKGQLFNRSFQ